MDAETFIRVLVCVFLGNLIVNLLLHFSEDEKRKDKK